MLVTLREINLENWNAVVELSLPEEQQGYVSSNLYSIAESRFCPEIEMQAAYAGDEPVGFVMFSVNPTDGHYWIWKLMIDGRQQGKGYGRATMACLLEHLRNKSVSKVVMISWTPDNTVAEQLYVSMGFRKTGEFKESQVVGRLDFRDDAGIL